MDDLIRAALLFWLPIGFFVLGIFLYLSRDSNIAKKLGASTSIISLALFLISPLTVPESPSTELSQLSWYILPVALLLFFGLYMTSFSGNVVVGKINSNYKYVGISLIFVSILAMILLQFYSLAPRFPDSSGQINKYWLIFWPTFLISGIGLSAFGFVLSENKKAMSICIVFFTGMFIVSSAIDGSEISARMFREILWLAGADLLGLLVGSVLSIAVFALVIFAYERNLPSPPKMDEPTEEEWSIISKHLASNLEVNEDE